MRTSASWLLLFLLGCADRDWRAAVSSGTAAGYGNYVRLHPGTAKASTAARRAEELAWQEAVAANQSTGFEGFRGAWPQSEHAAEAAAKAESLAWEEAGAMGSPGGYQMFLARYPRSPRAPEAEARIEELVFAEAQAKHTEDAYGRYLLRYPNGPHAGVAKKTREELAWTAATAADSVEAYRRFLAKYEGGEHTAEAKAWLDATLVARLQPAVVLLGTWQPDARRSTVLSRYRTELERAFLPELGREFKVDKLALIDTRATPWTHAQDRFGATPDVGILVIEVTERRGRVFEPDGYATDIDARLLLYTPNTRNPVVLRSLQASTPTKVRGIDDSALHVGAIGSLVAGLRQAEPELLAQHRKEP